MSPPQQASLMWIKARRSYAEAACVELASNGDEILLRDSKNPDVHLSYTRREVEAFLDGAKNGEFDHLVAGR